MIQEGLAALLQADAGVSAIIGAAGVYAVKGPPDLSKLPCVVYFLVGGSVSPTLDTSGVLRQRIQVDAVALTYAQAAQLRAAVIKATDRWSAKLGDGTNVLDTTIANPGTDDADEERLFTCRCEFYVLYTLPTS